MTLSAGCSNFLGGQNSSCEIQNRALNEQTKAQLAEISNLKAHARKLEDQLILAEEDLAMLERRAGTARPSASGLQARARAYQGVSQASGSAALQNATSQNTAPQGSAPQDSAPKIAAPQTADRERLAQLAQRYPELRYDPQTGLCKLDVGILFPSGDSTLDPDSRQHLAAVAKLVAAEGDGLHVMVVGHTDDLPIAGRDARQRFADNWHLSTARALAVADYLQRCGLRESQLGVAGYGRHEPVADNVSDDQRQLNRRVEIFVTGADTPIVGWTKTLPNLYR